MGAAYSDHEIVENAQSKKSPAITLRKILSSRETGVFIAVVFKSIFLTFASPNLMTVKNLLYIGRQVSLL